LRSERRQFLANREPRHFLAIPERHVRLNDEPLRPGAEAAKRRLDFTLIARKYKFCLQTNRERRFLLCTRTRPLAAESKNRL
jgi:hypothetical protein